MKNDFFDDLLDKNIVKQRIRQLSKAKVGFYSIGLYPASLAYNSAMQKSQKSLLLAPRPGRDLLGAFSEDEIKGMDPRHIVKMRRMACHKQGRESVSNTVEYLISKCELVLLSANSKYIQQDLAQACSIRKKLNRNNVVLCCLAGSFNHDEKENDSYVLCEKKS